MRIVKINNMIPSVYMHFPSIMCPIVHHHRCLSRPQHNVAQNRQKSIEQTNYLNKNNTTTHMTTTCSHKHQQGNIINSFAVANASADSPPNHSIKMHHIPNPPQHKWQQGNIIAHAATNSPPNCPIKLHPIPNPP